MHSYYGFSSITDCLQNKDCPSTALKERLPLSFVNKHKRMMTTCSLNALMLKRSGKPSKTGGIPFPEHRTVRP